MKNLYTKVLSRLFIVLSLASVSMDSYAQSGTSCSTPINIATLNVYAPTEYTFSANMVKWFSFYCDSPLVTLIIREPVIAEAASLSSVSIYNGCSTLIKTQTLTKQDSNKVDMVMNGLTVGLTYKIKIVSSTLGKFQLNLSSRSSGGPCTPATGCELINNGNFTQFNPNPIDTTPGKNAFNKQYVCYWQATANTPDIFQSSTPGFSPYFFAGWAQYDASEGLYQNLSKPLIKDRKYILSYSIRNYHPSNPKILSDYYVMIKNNSGGAFVSGTVAGTRQQIYHGTNVPHSATWATQYICFTANSNFNQIYFFGEMDTANTQAWLMLDNITLKMVDAGNDVVSSATCSSVGTTIGTSCVIAGATYSWSSIPVGGPYGTGSSINVSPSVNTTYTMTVTMPGGCTSTDKVTVYVNGCNLVQNSGFECKSAAPTTYDQIPLAQPWKAATTGIPDFYHKDAPPGSPVDVPTVVGQNPNGGFGMARIKAYANNTNQRDYLELLLSMPLTPGNYVVEMWVCLQINSFYRVQNLGIYISNDTIVNGTPVPPATYAPQIVGTAATPYYGYSWTKISGCYTSTTGGEKYITIGNFATDASTLKANGAGSDLNSYYFIDDVSIKKIGVSTNADTSIFCGQSKQLTAIATNSCGQPLTTSFSWSPSTGLNNPNIFNPVATPASTTSYIVTATMSGVGCTMKDTVTINVDTIPLVFYYGPNGSDTISICAEDSFPLWSWLISPPFQPGAFTGTGVDPITGWFYSSITGPGFHPVTYTYTSLPACTSIAHLTVWVKDSVSFPPLPTVIFCPGNYDTLLLNTATPVGENLTCSNYYGPGVVYDSINDVFYFDPAIAGAGVHTITYTYYDCVLGCRDTATQTITVDICNWVEQTIGTSGSNAQSNAVAVDPATGDVYVTGKVLRTVDFGGITTLTGPGPLYPTNFFIAKYNNCAELQWLKTAMGGAGNTAEGLAIAVDENGNAYVTGKFNGTFNFGGTSLNSSISGISSDGIFVAKYDSLGTCVWACKGGTTGADAGTGIAIDANNIYVTGYVGVAATAGSLEEPVGVSGGPTPLTLQSYQNFFIASYSQNTGDINWAKNNFTIDTTGSGQFSKSNAIALHSNLICVTGSYQGLVTLATGMILGFETMPSGFTACFNTSNGSPQWANIMAPSATNEYCEGKSIAINQDGDVFVTGNFKGFIHSPFYLYSVQDGSGAFTQDILVVKYDGSNGSTIWVNGEGGEGTDGGQAICLDDESAYVTGYFAGSSNADFSGTAMSGFGTGTKDVFVVKYIGSNGNLATVSQPVKEYGGSGNDQGNGICLGPASELLITGTFRNPNADFDGITLTPGTTNDEIFLKNICDAQNNFKINGGKQDENTSQTLAADAKNQVNLFPNPTKDLFTIQWSLVKESSPKIIITDVFGRKIYQSNLNHSTSGKQEVDMSMYVSGLYFVHINAEGINSVIKLVKQ